MTALGLDRDDISQQGKGRKGKDFPRIRVIYYETNHSWGKQEEGCTSAVLRYPSWNEKVTNNLHLQVLQGKKAEICALSRMVKEHINSLSDQRTRNTSGVSGSIGARISLLQKWGDRDRGGKNRGERGRWIKFLQVQSTFLTLNYLKG